MNDVKVVVGSHLLIFVNVEPR